jgi:hypothetical protein
MRLSSGPVALSLLASVHRTVSFAPQPSKSIQSFSFPKLFALGYDPMRKDMKVTFGSGEDEEDIDTTEGDRQRDQRARKARIEELLEDQDQEFREERKRKVWGKFSNATTKEDIAKLEREEAEQIARGTWNRRFP